MKPLYILMLCFAMLRPASDCAGTVRNEQGRLRKKFQGAGAVCVCGAPGAARPDLKWNETHVGRRLRASVFELRT